MSASKTSPSEGQPSPADDAGAGLGRLRAALILLFFLSGAAALIYQVVWARMLHLVFGVTSFAVATVLSAFMAGLALGSLLGGRYVDRHGDPLRAFSALQIGIGLFALVFPFVLDGLTGIYVLIHQQWATTFYVFSLMRFALAFVVLLVPTTMMGATLPVLVKWFVRRPERLGSDVGALYSANNWGAVLGALAAGFVLMEALGVRETSYLAAALSVGIGLACLALRRRAGPAQAERTPEAAPGPAEEPVGPAYPRYVMYVVLWVFALEGFTSLAYEVVWTRMLAASSIVITIYAYSLVVATFIVGLAIGSYLIRRYADRVKDLLSLLGGIEIAIGLTAVGLLPLFKVSEGLFAWASGFLRGWGPWTAATAAWTAALILVPTTLMGATFPLVSRIYTINFRELGKRIGVVGFLDTVGSIFGAFAGGFILIPLLGMQGSVLTIAAVNGALGLAVILAHPRLRARRKVVVTGGLVAAGALVWLFVPHQVRFLPWGVAQGGFHLLDYEESMDATVVVGHYFGQDWRGLAVNGTDVAGTGRLLESTQIAQAHLPALIYEAQNGRPPTSAVTVGLGSGGTSYSLSLHESLEDIHCVELTPAVPRAAKEHFQMINRNVFSDPRFRITIQDGRTYMLAARKKYDLVLDDSVHPAYHGSASLYSRDFFQHCRDRLTEGGVMSVWIPVSQMSHEGLRMIFKSFLDVFPHAALWHWNNERNKHTVLIGLQEPMSLDFQKFARRVGQPAIAADLAQVDLDSPYVLLTSLWMDTAALREYSSDAPLHTDNHPRLAFNAPRSLLAVVRNDAWLERLNEMRPRPVSVLPRVKNLGETEQEAARNRKRLQLEEQAAAALNGAFFLRALGEAQLKKDQVTGALSNFRQAREAARRARALSPQNPTCALVLSRCAASVAEAFLRLGQLDAASTWCRRAIQADPDHGGSYMVMSNLQFARGNRDEWIAYMEKAVETEPHRLTWRYDLAGRYFNNGQIGKARQELLRLLEELPGNEIVKDRLKEVGAAAESRRAVQPPAG
ncbi:MAG: fused MFS/spermidine synthase [Candidatus Brocadiia bacterium]